MTLYEEWVEAKEAEKQATDHRREIEDKLTKSLNLHTQDEGSKTLHLEGYTVKVTQRINKSIDADKLQDIANEEGLEGHLSTLFRWKPDIIKKAWENADESITRPLADAITSKPGRPSYSISKEEE